MRRTIVFVVLGVALAGTASAAPRPSKKYTRLLLSAAEVGDVAGIEKALKMKGALEATDPEGNTALLRAAESGHADAVATLLAAGANVHARNTGGLDALMRGARSGDHATVDALLRAGASTATSDQRSRTALMLAAYRGSVPVVEALLTRGADPRARDENGRFPLDFAIEGGQSPAATTLLRAMDAQESASWGAAPPLDTATPESAPEAASAPTAGAAAMGDFAIGTLTVNGGTVTLRHAYLIPDRGTPPAVLVYLTDVPVEPEILREGSFAIRKVTDAGEACVVQIRATLSDRQATSSSVYHRALRGGETSVVGAGDWKASTVSAERVEGRVSMEKPREVPEGTYRFSATFSATSPATEAAPR